DDPKKAFGAIARIHKTSEELTPQQKARLEAFTRRYNAKTKGSKRFTQENRAQLSDPRVVSGFRPAIKELVYPIVVDRSEGSRIWDIDGNEYVDVLNGFRSEELTPQQKARLEAFTRRYNAKTKGSKRFTQENRAQLSDPRVVSGFRPAIKELVYPIVVDRSEGSRIWDIDGNEYVDVLNGF